jgi:hypothetical protein
MVAVGGLAHLLGDCIFRASGEESGAYGLGNPNLHHINEMKRSHRLLMTAAAMAGLYAGALAARTHAQDSGSSGSGDSSKAPSTDKHGCKGQNSCKGKGGCSSGDNGCAGKNSCSGKGGCATDGSKKPSGG